MATIPRPRKPRYVVRDSAGRALRETDSKLTAWWVWFKNRRDGAIAHDRLSWIEDERSWLRCGVVTSDGGAGADWMAEYDLEVVKVD